MALQHAGGAEIDAVLQQVARRGERGPRAGTGQARQRSVVGRHVRRHHAGRQAGCAGGRMSGTVEHRDLPAAQRQRARHGGAGQPGADDGAARWLRHHGRLIARAARPRRPARGVTRAQRGRRPRCGGAFDLKTAGDEPLAHLVRHAPRRQACTTARQPCDGAQRVQAPHLRIARGLETVEKNAVVLARQLGQHGLHVADGERQLHLPAVQPQPVHAGQQAVPWGDQRFGQRRQFGEGGGAAPQVIGLRRKGFDRRVKQLARPLGRLPPRVPGGEKVEAEAKAGLQHLPAWRAAPDGLLPGRRQQPAAVQKNLPCLRQRAGGPGAAVDVAKARAERRAVVAPAHHRVGHELLN